MTLASGEAASCEFTFCGGQHDDPQWAGGDAMLFAMGRCCLYRTLLSFNGTPTNQGGTVLRPDIAQELPAISSDGLTWTFSLRRGLHYAPPLQDTEITAPDFIRSIERLLGPPPSDGPDYYGGMLDPYLGGYLDLRGRIAGGQDYIDGKTQHITGLEAPDPYTLRIHLTREDATLGSLLALPDTTPIAPNPFDPSARNGVLEGHDRLAVPYMVSSGPYMIEGADVLDYSKPAAHQLPPVGDAPDSLTLVRNPSWSPDADALRPAQPDRIVLVPVVDGDQALQKMTAGDLDLVYNWDPEPALLGSDSLPEGMRVYPTTLDWSVFVEMNLAMPPFDDVHVRRAINLAIPRDDVAAAFAGDGQSTMVSTHIGLDSEEDNLLATFDPFHAATGDVEAARQEMAQSGYDHDQDGRCDDPACSGIDLLAVPQHTGEIDAARLIAADVEAIGLGIRVKEIDRFDYAQLFNDIRSRRIPLIMGNWIKDLTSGSTFFPQLFGSDSGSASLLGASPAELAGWGYDVASVPSVDGLIDRCPPQSFGAQARCWAELDRYLMSEVVPWVPLVTLTGARLVSARVDEMTIDQSPPVPMPALDHVVLKPGEVASPLPDPPAEVPAIPNGVYRVEITREDALRFDPHAERGDIEENTGSFTVYLRGGRFELVITADHPLYNPITVGIYEGSGDQVIFTTQRPVFDAIDAPTERWTFDGTHLTFELASCRDLATRDPENPALCQGLRTWFEAHPWEKVG